MTETTPSPEPNTPLDLPGHKCRMPARSGEEPPLFDAEESAAMARLNDFMADLRRWGLRANWTEVVAAIHVLQGFVVQRAVSRRFQDMSDWYAATPDKPPEPPTCQYHGGHGDCGEPRISSAHGERPPGQLGGVHRFASFPTSDPWAGDLTLEGRATTGEKP